MVISDRCQGLIVTLLATQLDHLSFSGMSILMIWPSAKGIKVLTAFVHMSTNPQLRQLPGFESLAVMKICCVKRSAVQQAQPINIFMQFSIFLKLGGFSSWLSLSRYKKSCKSGAHLIYCGPSLL